MTQELDLDALQAIADKGKHDQFSYMNIHCTTMLALLDRLRKAEAARDIDSIDSRFTQRLALLLECMMIDSNGHWNQAANLLDEYKAAWDRINPTPPTFMGEPMPPERRARLMTMKENRAAPDSTDPDAQTQKGTK